MNTFLVLFVADVSTTTVYSVDNASSTGTVENSDGTYSGCDYVHCFMKKCFRSSEMRKEGGDMEGDVKITEVTGMVSGALV